MLSTEEYACNLEGGGHQALRPLICKLPCWCEEAPGPEVASVLSAFMIPGPSACATP